MVKTSIGFAALSAVLLTAGCQSSPDPQPVPVTSSAPALYDIATMRAGLVSPNRLGDGWEVLAIKPDLTRTRSFCADHDPDSAKADKAAPPMPAGAEVATSYSSKDWSATSGVAQSAIEYALVLPAVADAEKAVFDLRNVADACPAGVVIPQAAMFDGYQRPGYAERMRVTDVSEKDWSGFQVQRRRTNDLQPGAAAIFITVLQHRNAILILDYAGYNSTSSVPEAIVEKGAKDLNSLAAL